MNEKESIAWDGEINLAGPDGWPMIQKAAQNEGFVSPLVQGYLTCRRNTKPKAPKKNGTTLPCLEIGKQR